MEARNELRSLIHSHYQHESTLAELLGWSRQKLNAITTGKREASLLDAWRLANALDVSVNDMARILLFK